MIHGFNRLFQLSDRDVSVVATVELDAQGEALSAEVKEMKDSNGHDVHFSNRAQEQDFLILLMDTAVMEVAGKWTSKSGNYVVTLSAEGNPDFDEDEDFGVPTERLEVESLAAARDACLAFIHKHNLGGGNWSGGQITIDGRLVARVSYNGRVWNPEGIELKHLSAGGR